jgi:DNA polymerase-3 subunit chi
MPEIWFYHLVRQPLESALPILLERSLARGWKAVVQAASEERVAALDTLLWTWSESSFLAHGVARDGDGALQPVYLTTGTETPNGAAVRFLIEGSDAAEALADENAAYERLVLMFDGADEEQLAGARAQWRRLKDEGRTLSYWQQDDDGRWVKKA